MSENGPDRNTPRYEPCGRHPGAPWFVIWTKPNLERQAEHSLRCDGFPTFFPYHVVTRKDERTGKRSDQIEPLFRRYGFAQPNDARQWVGMLYARGVSRVLRNPHGVPKSVPSSIVDLLLSQCAPNGVIYPVEPQPLVEGQNLKVTDGPFAELRGICSRSPKERVWVLLNIMGRQVEVPFRPEQVEAA